MCCLANGCCVFFRFGIGGECSIMCGSNRCACSAVVVGTYCVITVHERLRK